MTTASGSRRDDWSAPLAGMFLLTLLGGVLCLSFVPETWASLRYVEGRCVVLDKRLFEHRPGDDSYRPEFLIRYTVAGREYQAWTYDAVRASTAFRWPNERILDRFTVGQAYPCWYDPADPSRVVLVRGYSWWTCGLMLVVGVLLFFTARAVLWRLRAAKCATDEAAGAGGMKLSGAPLPAIGARAPPAALRRNPQEVRRPGHLSVKDRGNSLRIRFRWVWRRFTGAAMMCLVWNSFVVLWYWNAVRSGGPFMWLALIITAPHGAIGLLLVYATLAGLLNRTVVTVTPEALTVRNGPVPWWGNRTVPTDGLERLDCDRDAAAVGHGQSHVYCVHARTKGAGKVDLVPDLDRAHALFIAQELGRWLEAHPRPGAGLLPLCGMPGEPG